MKESDIVEVTKLISELSPFFDLEEEAEEVGGRGESSLDFFERLEEEGFFRDFLGESALEEAEPDWEEEAGRSLRGEEGTLLLRDFEGTSVVDLEAEEEESLGWLTTLEHGGDGLENRKIKNKKII